jgi:N,N'-diacetyllegionaminate synthase
VKPDEIQIGNRTLGESQPPFVIAELGYNFNTLDEALRSVDAAAEAGVDAIKLQTFRAETLTVKTIDFPTEAGGSNQYQEFKRYEIDEETHRKVFARARKRGLIPFSTPSHYNDVKLLQRVGIDVFKIGSDDLTNLPFVRFVAKQKKPVIFSSGMATLAEVDEAIRAMHESGNKDLILLHCVSNYPVKDASLLNIRVVEAYRKAFPVLVGYSDHSTSVTAAIAAVTLGAVAIERHFVIDKNLPAPDAFFSADPEEMADLVKAVREAHSMLGSGYKAPTATEKLMRLDTRKGLVAVQSIRRGELITPKHIAIKRPGTGILPREFERVIGRKARRNIKEDEVITWEMV